jgi:hypothetical protein
MFRTRKARGSRIRGGRGRPPQREQAAALLAAAGVLAAACGSAAAPASSLRTGSAPASGAAAPAVSRVSQPARPAAAAPRPSAGPLVMPPFGSNVKIIMTSWLPASAGEARAVVTAKDFLLAVLFAEYTGGLDNRWEKYVGSSLVLRGMTAVLSAPGVNAESFTGTIRFWRMSAVPGTYGKNTISVTECVDTAGLRNTSLTTGNVLPPGQQLHGGQNWYSNTDVLALTGPGRWAVVSIPPVTEYPEAQCRP